MVGNGDFVKRSESSISTSESHKTFSGVSGLISGFNSNGVDSGNSEFTEQRSRFSISMDSIRKTDESPYGSSRVMLSLECIFEFFSNLDIGFVRFAGKDSEGFVDFSTIV